MEKQRQFIGVAESAYLYVTVGTVCYDETDTYFQRHLPATLRRYSGQSREGVLAAAGYITFQQVSANAWKVELTPSGRQNIETTFTTKGDNNQKSGCDSDNVTFALSRLTDLAVLGIIEDGVHAKVDILMNFAITPVGLAVRKEALSIASRALDASTLDGRADRGGFMSSLFGAELAYTFPSDGRYVKSESFTFDKYDDGWRINLHSRPFSGT